MDGSYAFRTSRPRTPGRLTAVRNRSAGVVHRLAKTRLWRWAWYTDHDDSIPATTGVAVQCALIVALILAQAPAAFAMVLATPAILMALMVTEHSRDPRSG